MRVRWLRTALRNLDAEASFIAEDDPAAAGLVVQRVMAAVAMLAAISTALGRPGRVPNTRELVVSRTRYIVPYRVRGDSIEILRVLHTSRRLPQKW